MLRFFSINSDQPSVVFCEQCTDGFDMVYLDYCEVCFAHQHRKGNRKKHTVKKLRNTIHETPKSLAANIIRQFTISADKEEKEELNASDFIQQSEITENLTFGNFIERSKYIPLRLTYNERKYLRLLEAGLNVCEYTDKIDVIVYGSKSKRIVAQIKELCSILSGLVLAADYTAGQELFKDRDFEHNAEFFQNM
jgi:hypothetical protein